MLTDASLWEGGPLRFRPTAPCISETQILEDLISFDHD